MIWLALRFLLGFAVSAQPTGKGSIPRAKNQEILKSKQTLEKHLTRLNPFAGLMALTQRVLLKLNWAGRENRSETMRAKQTTEVMNEQELTLLRRVAEQDREALTELFLTYHPRLFKFVFRLTHSYTIADEMVNDIMLLVWQKATTFRGDSKVSTWIFGIAYRQTMRRVTRKQIKISAVADLNELSSDDDSSIELENWVQQGLDSLPAAQQIAVELVFYLGLSYQEVAKVTDCSVNTVKTRMFHARKKLKGFLAVSAEPTDSRNWNNDD